MDESPLNEAVLHVGLTRPALLWGVPLEIASVLVMIFGVIGVLKVLYAPVVIPLWFGTSVLCRRDYHAGRVTVLWLRTTASALDSARWGGPSLTPFPIRPPRRFRGIAPDAR